jgi:hypothetical protein
MTKTFLWFAWTRNLFSFLPDDATLRRNNYEAFEPKEALRLAKRLEMHHTLKHGSWLDIAEIELSALGN